MRQNKAVALIAINKTQKENFLQCSHTNRQKFFVATLSDKIMQRQRAIKRLQIFKETSYDSNEKKAKNMFHLRNKMGRIESNMYLLIFNPR